MRMPGRIERRLALALLLVAVLPLISSILVARSLVERATSLFFNADVGPEVERSLTVYNDLAKAMKAAMRAKADAIAAHEPLRAAAILSHKPSLKQELGVVFPRYPDLVSVRIEDADGELLATQSRGKPIDPKTERSLTVIRPLTKGEEGAQMIAVFAANRKRLDYQKKAAEFLQTYRVIEREKTQVERSYLYSFAALIGITIALSSVLGILLARPITQRMNRLSTAAQQLGAGDLSLRVPEEGNDEITDLARALNRSLDEVENNRARIEYLQRIGAWQDMARRLAHEIKNPLTPIQLAVQECHQRCPEGDPVFRGLVDTTREIVEEEIATLRRLVGEFSNFARMPRAELEEQDLGDFLREHEKRLLPIVEAEINDEGSEQATLTLALSREPLPVALDPDLLHRVLANLVRNGAQAVAEAGEKAPAIKITARLDSVGIHLMVDDNGPGIPAELLAQIFDPYVTTKTEGTGLGLAIVKKIIVEHGGIITAGSNTKGGCRMHIILPQGGSAESQAALAAANRRQLAITM